MSTPASMGSMPVGDCDGTRTRMPVHSLRGANTEFCFLCTDGTDAGLQMFRSVKTLQTHV